MPCRSETVIKGLLPVYGAFFLCAFSLPAFCQSSDPGGSSPCQAPGIQQNGAMAKTDRKPANPGAMASTDLSNCNGVLKPPETGDKGIVEPAPQTGTMPEIKPGETPQQQPGK